MPRTDGRAPDQLRKIEYILDVAPHAAGSVLIAFGNTRVICTACINEEVPRWMKVQGVKGGWLTAEYSMLPYSTLERKDRESSRGKPDGRSTEIQRLIGRSLRAVVDLEKLGPRTLYVDCDVLQADGGTRTAAITGAWVAMASALNYLRDEGVLKADPILDQVAAVSCGVCDGVPVLDLDYEEDSEAEADSNFVLTGAGQIVEIQATGEKRGFSRAEFDRLFALAETGCAELFALQKAALEAVKR
jgi:ribonuclease PH